MSDDVSGPLDVDADRSADLASFHRWGFSDLTRPAARVGVATGQRVGAGHAVRVLLALAETW